MSNEKISTSQATSRGMAIGALLIMLIAVTFMRCGPPVKGAQKFVAASTQYYTNTLVTVPANYDFTMFARIYQRSTPANMVAMYWGNFATGGGNDCARFLDSAGSCTFQMIRSGASVTAGTMALSVSNWYSIAGVAALTSGSNVFNFYVDGVPKGTNSILTNSNAHGTIAIGARANSSAWGLLWDGDIQDVALWTAPLTANELKSLAQGASPRQIRPDKLFYYVPMGERVIDVAGGLVPVKTGTPGAIDNSPPYQWGLR